MIANGWVTGRAPETTKWPRARCALRTRQRRKAPNAGEAEHSAKHAWSRGHGREVAYPRKEEPRAPEPRRPGSRSVAAPRDRSRQWQGSPPRRRPTRRVATGRQDAVERRPANRKKPGVGEKHFVIAVETPPGPATEHKGTRGIPSRRIVTPGTEPASSWPPGKRYIRARRTAKTAYSCHQRAEISPEPQADEPIRQTLDRDRYSSRNSLTGADR